VVVVGHRRARRYPGAVTASIPEGVLRLADRTGRRAAAFDADGVLWNGDVSEDFTRWMIDRGWFDGALWEHYEAVNRRDPAAGCVEILRFYRGHELSELRARVAEFWRSAAPRRWKATVIATFRWLAGHGFSVFVVSGTPRVVLEPLAQHLPVAHDHIVALELAVDRQGRATGGPSGVVTCGPGKALRLQQAWSGPVLFAAGNSILDIEMLQLSEGWRWAVDPDPQLRALATRSGWPIYDTPHG
jgi:HAD superfamily phosphoserine phosphatase-like hydrolase